jgi:hypothetical protein
LAEPTPIGETIVAVVNAGFLVYNAVQTLEMSRGKSGMQGGGQNRRDAGMRGREQGFDRWVHKQKDPSDPDFTVKEINDLYKEWIKLGKPIPKK